MKRSQVTFFIIFGIIALSSVVMLIHMRHAYVKDSEQVLDTNYAYPIKEYLDNCFSDVIKKGIANISSKGGYYEVPTEPIDLSALDTSFWYIYGENFEPFQSTIEIQLAYYLLNNSEKCTNNSVFEEQGLNVSIDKIESASFQIRQGRVDATIKCPVTINQGADSVKLYDFFIKTDSEFKEVIDAAHGIVSRAYHPDFSICEPVLCNNISSKVMLSYNYSSLPYSVLFEIRPNSTTEQINYTFRYYIQKKLNDSYGDSPIKKRTAVVYPNPPIEKYLMPMFGDKALNTLSQALGNAFDQMLLIPVGHGRARWPNMDTFFGESDKFSALLLLGGTEAKLGKKDGLIVAGGTVVPNEIDGKKIDDWIAKGNSVWINMWGASEKQKDEDEEDYDEKEKFPIYYLNFKYQYQKAIMVAPEIWAADIKVKLRFGTLTSSVPVYNSSSLLLHCPNEIEKNLSESVAFRLYSGPGAEHPSIIMGPSNKEMALWSDKWGKGDVVIDHYGMKDGAYGLFFAGDKDIEDKGIAKQYYENVLYHLLTLSTRSENPGPMIDSYCDSALCQKACCQDSNGINHTNYDSNRCRAQGGEPIDSVCSVDVFCS